MKFGITRNFKPSKKVSLLVYRQLQSILPFCKGNEIGNGNWVFRTLSGYVSFSCGKSDKMPSTTGVLTVLLVEHWS
jgi:hypothetical protein